MGIDRFPWIVLLCKQKSIMNSFFVMCKPTLQTEINYEFIFCYV